MYCFKNKLKKPYFFKIFCICYRNQSIHQDYRECATRFLGLAPVGNKAKEKWIYACSLQAISRMRMTDLLQATTDETVCPYDVELMKQHQPGKVVKVKMISEVGIQPLWSSFNIKHTGH